MAKAIRFKTSSNEPLYACPYYPVGSIYMAVNNINPGTIFGGTWEQIKDRFLLCAGSSYSAGSTGGSKTHTHTTGNCTLTQEQIPAHSHGVVVWGYDVSGSVDRWTATTNWKSKVAGESQSNRWIGQSWETGSGQAHNHGNTGSSSNMPPYLAVYVWKRVS